MKLQQVKEVLGANNNIHSIIRLIRLRVSLVVVPGRKQLLLIGTVTLSLVDHHHMGIMPTKSQVVVLTLI